MTIYVKNQISIVALIAAATLASVPALAQDEEGGVVAANSSEDEVIVTATRRSTSIQETALSISAYGGEELEKKGFNSIGQFVDLVPGITLGGSDASGNRIIIRNVATSTQEAGSAVIATYLDDFAVTPGGITGGGSAEIRLVDVERVEVLKGPQGTLFGRSAMGGIVRYITNKPDATATYGGVNTYLSTTTDGGTNVGGHGYINLPLSNTFAVRGVGYVYENSGFIDNTELGVEDFNNEKTIGGRVAAHWQATDNFSLGLTYLNQNIDSALNWVTTTRDPGDIAVAGDEGPDSPPDVEARTAIGGVRNEFDDNRQIFNLKMDYDFDDFAATFLATRTKDKTNFVFDQREFVGIASGCTCDFLDPSIEQPENQTDILEFRLVSSSSGDKFFDWIAGVYYENFEGGFHQQVRQLGPDQLLFGFLPVLSGTSLIDAIGEETSSEIAAYGEVSANFTQDTRLTLGYRRSHVEFGQTSRLADGLFSAFTGANLLVDIPFETKENVNTYKATLEHSFSDDIFAYATAASGYRRGGFNKPTAISMFSTFDSDSLWNYEAGFKTTWIDGRLTANVSGYVIDYTDIQLVVQNPTTFARETKNSGSARIAGVEAMLALKVNDYLDLSFAGALSSAKMRADVIGTATAGVPGSGINDGDRLPGSANSNFTIQAEWNKPIGKGFEVTGNLSYKYTGSRNNDFNLVRDSEVLPSYQIVDARIGLVNEKGYSISLFANNLFDEAVTFLIDRQNPGTNYRAIPTNRPRTVGLNLTHTFR